MARQFNWWLPAYGALGAVIMLPAMIFGNNVGPILAMVAVAAIVSLIILILLVGNIRRQSLSALSMLVIFCALSWLLFIVSDDVRTTGRWLFESKAYKAEVLAQPCFGNGELEHVEWDGWGFAGAGDTVVYLVLDPNDSLAVAAKRHSSGKFSGIPCEVRRVRRLEKHWYAVLFYTDTAWDYCN